MNGPSRLDGYRKYTQPDGTSDDDLRRQLNEPLRGGRDSRNGVELDMEDVDLTDKQSLIQMADLYAVSRAGGREDEGGTAKVMARAVLKSRF